MVILPGGVIFEFVSLYLTLVLIKINNSREMEFRTIVIIQ